MTVKPSTLKVTVVFPSGFKQTFRSAKDLQEYVEQEEQNVVNAVSILARELLREGGWTVQNAVDEAMHQLLSTEFNAQYNLDSVLRKFLEQRPSIVRGLESARPPSWGDATRHLRAVNRAIASRFFR
jgi:hypothetical protein